MRRLVQVELRRYLARRLVKLLVGLAVVGILIGGTVMFVRSHRLDPARARELQQQAEADRRASVRACSAGEFGVPPSEIPPGESLAEFCEEIVGPPQVQDRAFHLTDVRGTVLGISGLLITLFLLLGASFTGAEWHAGTITTLLTWEPRRLRVHAAKVAVAGAVAFVGTLVLLALLGAVLVPTAVFRGTTIGADAMWFRGLVGLVLRAAAGAALAATVGAAVATIGRNTAAALGVAFGYLAILEPLLRGLRPGWRPWLVTNNLGTFVEGSRSLNPEFASRSPVGAGVLIGVYALAIVAIAGAMFRARDVT